MQNDNHLKKPNSWNNSGNYAYYDNISIEVLQSFAVKGGFENGCDIDLIYDHLKDKESILEVGAAYGRVIKNILARGYTGKLYALERSPHLYQHLQINFGNKAEIIHDNVQTFKPHFKVDVILMLWAFIFDFSRLEQLEMLEHVASWLKPNGAIILDTLLHTLIPDNAFFAEGQTHIICSGNNKYYAYATSKSEIREYAKHLGVDSVEHLDYKTSTQRERILHILKF